MTAARPSSPWSAAGWALGSLLLAPSAWAANVGGAISANTTWTPANSPYVVTSSVTVYNNATLTIEPGVTVRFNLNTGLTLGAGTAGILKAQGTMTAPITFTSNSATPAPGQWNGINVVVTTAASILDRCVVEYGGAGTNDANIRVSSSTPTIHNCAIRSSDGHGIFVTGANVRPSLIGNTITANGRYPLRLQIDAFPTSFSGNSFTANGLQLIELFGGSVTANATLPHPGIPYAATSSIFVSSANATLTLQPGVQLRFNLNTGLSVSSGRLMAQGTATQPILFTSNSATQAPGQWSGISLTSTTAPSLLDYCAIEYGGAGANDANLYVASSANPTIRHATIRSSDGAGIRLSSARPVLEHNTITGNLHGIAVASVDGQELIRHNTITGNTSTGLTNSATNGGVNARLNWWGHASGPAGIGPGSGSVISGNVLFEPWLSQTASDPFRWVDAGQAPDPFSQSGGVATFFGALSQPANWTITINNSAGALVRTLTGSGTSVAQDWTGTDTSGATLPNGTYTFQMDATSTSGALVAAPALGSVALDNALPIANITAPTPNQVVVAGAINIVGTAAGANFKSYQVEYGIGVSPTSWSLIKSATTPVTNGVLASWNAAALTGSVYTLRLTVTSTTAQTAGDLVTVQLLNSYNLSDAPDPFSPNGDGVSETTTLSARTTLPVTWTLTIKNSAATVVRTFAGSGSTISQSWDGKNASAALVPDGLYTYQFQGTEPGSGLIVTSAIGQVTVDRTAPTAAITSPTQNQAFLTDAPIPVIGTASDTNFSSYSLTVIGPSGTFTLAFTTGPVVNGTLGTVNPQGWKTGTYTLRLTVTDRAGTVSKLDRLVLLDHLQISAISTSPSVIDPSLGQQASINYTLSRAANLTIRLYHAVTKQLTRTITAPGKPAGANATLWNGRASDGAVAPLEAYYFTIEAIDTANANRKGTYNNATTPFLGPLPSTTNATVSATNFNPYRNDLVQINYTVNLLGRMTIKIFDASQATIRTLLNQAIRTAGAQTELWDGRRDNGSLYNGAFSVFFDAPQAPPANPIVLQQTPLAANLRAEAYVIQPVFGEVSTLTYALSRNATITLTVTDPNGNMIRTLLSNVSQTAGAKTAEWNGRTDAGTVVAVEGDYKITLTAVDPVSGMNQTLLGALVVYK